MKFAYSDDYDTPGKEFVCTTERGVKVHARFIDVTRMWQIKLNDTLTAMDMQEIGQLLAMFAGMAETIKEGFNG